MNENCCLCKCFTELHFFYWLLVVSCNLNRFAVCFQSFINIVCRSTQNAARIKRFLRLHILIKPLNKKNKHNKFFIMLKRTLLVFTENLALVKSENRLALYVILEIFWTVLLKAHAFFMRFWILNECNLCGKLWNTAFWGLYDKNGASYYCFTSDVMYEKYEMLVYTHPELLARFW